MGLSFHEWLSTRCIDAVGTDAHGTGLSGVADRVKQRAKLEVVLEP